MRKILCSAIALAFMAAPVYAEPVKMTTTQLDEVTAGGARKFEKKNLKVKFRDVNAAVNVLSDVKIDNSVVTQIAVALQNVTLGNKAKLTIDIDAARNIRIY